MDEKKKNSFRQGLSVFFALVILTVIEFVVASLNPDWAWLLFLLAIFKGWLVIQYYMHINRIFKEESH